MKPTRYKVFDDFYDINRISYRLNGEVHREDGPAIVWDDGAMLWYKDGTLHREDGPAIINSDGSMKWYLNGKEITQ